MRRLFSHAAASLPDCQHAPTLLMPPPGFQWRSSGSTGRNLKAAPRHNPATFADGVFRRAFLRDGGIMAKRFMPDARCAPQSDMRRCFFMLLLSRPEAIF